MHLNVNEDTAPEVLSGFRILLEKAPRFAEAYNQRTIVYFRIGELAKAVADCEKTLRMNPFHFGACQRPGPELHAAEKAPCRPP